MAKTIDSPVVANSARSVGARMRLRRGSLRARTSLTTSGKVTEVVGFLSVGLGIQISNRALLIFGGVLLLPVLVGAALTYVRVRTTLLEVRRPSRARVAQSSPIRLTVTARFGASSLLIRDPLNPKRGVSERCDGLGAGEIRTLESREFHSRRGLVSPPELVISSARPFGLARTEKTVAAESSILVLPQLGVLRGRLLSLVGRGRPSRHPIGRNGLGAEIRQVRPYVPGDPRRAIHWPSSARAQRIMVREWDDDEQGTLVLLVGMPTPTGSAARAAVEHTVSLAATLLHRSLGTVILVLPRQAPFEVIAGHRASRCEAEERLATLGPAGWPDIPRTRPRPNEWRMLLNPGFCDPPISSETMVLNVSQAVLRGEFVAGLESAE